MVELAVLLLVDDLFVGKGRSGDRAPVYHALAALDVAFFIEPDEHLFDRVAEPVVHREAFALPVAGGSELAELADDRSAVLLAPGPDTLHELFASELVAARALLFAQILFHAAFRGDSGVIGAGEPADLVSFHPVPASENVLKRVVEHMPHREDSRDVRRRNDDGIRFFRRIGPAVEQPVAFPPRIPFFLDGRGFICFGHLCVRHDITPE